MATPKKGTKGKKRPKYEFLNASWVRDHSWDGAGNALLRDLETMVAGYEWLHSDQERRQYVLEDLVELGSVLLVTATRELREDAGLRERRRGKRPNAIDIAPVPNRPIEVAP